MVYYKCHIFIFYIEKLGPNNLILASNMCQKIAHLRSGLQYLEAGCVCQTIWVAASSDQQALDVLSSVDYFVLVAHFI